VDPHAADVPQVKENQWDFAAQRPTTSYRDLYVLPLVHARHEFALALVLLRRSSLPLDKLPKQCGDSIRGSDSNGA
jgi:hypothetical protein